MYHCVFGDLEESLQSCCHNALAEASKEELRTIVFWLDGFASLSGNIAEFEYMRRLKIVPVVLFLLSSFSSYCH